MSFFDGFGGALLGGLGGLIGGISNNENNAEEAARNRSFNAKEAEKNRRFQRNMSNTSYQRGTADMIAAGINPMVAFSQGGASTPSGSAASGDAAHFEDAIGKSISSATEGARLKKDLKLADKEILLKDANIAATEASRKLTDNSAAKVRTEEELLRKTMPASLSTAERTKNMNDIINSFTGPGSELFKKLKSLLNGDVKPDPKVRPGLRGFGPLH